MTPGQRTTYFRLWTAACRVKGWDAKDDTLRRDQVIHCMAAVRGPLVTTSDPLFGQDAVTALFTYLDFLGNPDSLEKSARWLDCQQDYRAFNRARQADWHERAAYGPKGSRKLQQNRFGGQEKAQGEMLESFDPDAIQKRFLTAVTRHEAKGYRRPSKARKTIFVVNGDRIVSRPAKAPVETAAQVREPDPF